MRFSYICKKCIKMEVFRYPPPQIFISLRRKCGKISILPFFRYVNAIMNKARQAYSSYVRISNKLCFEGSFLCIIHNRTKNIDNENCSRWKPQKSSLEEPEIVNLAIKEKENQRSAISWVASKRNIENEKMLQKWIQISKRLL